MIHKLVHIVILSYANGTMTIEDVLEVIEWLYGSAFTKR
jgi:hypothetical protein